MTCLHCRHENEGGARFCSQCAAPLTLAPGPATSSLKKQFGRAPIVIVLSGHWYYQGSSCDPISGRTDTQVRLVIDGNGHVTMLNFS
jgi:hypothetical protein